MEFELDVSYLFSAKKAKKKEKILAPAYCNQALAVKQKIAFRAVRSAEFFSVKLRRAKQGASEIETKAGRWSAAKT